MSGALTKNIYYYFNNPGAGYQGVILIRAEASTFDETVNLLKNVDDATAAALSSTANEVSNMQTGIAALNNYFNINGPNLVREIGALAMGAVLGGAIGAWITAGTVTILGAPVAIALGVILGGFIIGNEISEQYKKSWDSANDLGRIISRFLINDPDPLVKDVRYVWVDPLVLDLDGDGLEISPLSRGVQFDTNGDTIRTATAWVHADDGLLVLDRNGNGMIDSGQELFGDETLLANGQKAAHGFAALAELDVGGAEGAIGGAGDGLFDAKDAQYANVRVWRDLNQDGVSQAHELQTMAEAGIVSIKLSSTATSTQYGDAQLVQSGSFTRADGSEGQAGSFILAQNNGVTTHPPISISTEAMALPGIQGSGWVRGLQDAATLNPDLLRHYAQAQNAGNRAGFVGGVSEMLLEWGMQSDYKTASEVALEEDGIGLILRNPADAQEISWMPMAIRADKASRDAFRSTLTAAERTKFDSMRESMVGQLEKLYTYEAFTGHTFLRWSDIKPRFFPPSDGAGNGRPVTLDVPLSQVIQEKGYAPAASLPGYRIAVIPPPLSGKPHIDMLWDRLVEDASKNMMPAVRLSQYTDMVQLNVSESGAALDFSQLDSALDAASSADAYEGAALFLDMYRAYGKGLKSVGWAGEEKLRALMQAGASNEAIRKAFKDTGLSLVAATSTQGSVNDDVYAGSDGANGFDGSAGNDFIDGRAGNDTLSGAMGDDVILGGAGDDVLNGGDGADILDGSVGADTLDGGAGNDTLDGGAGDDRVNGGIGNNTYLFGRGDGVDTIGEYNDASAGKRNVLHFKAGVSTSDVSVSRSGDYLVLSINGTTDKVSVTSFFYQNTPANTWNPLQAVVFDDGTTWDMGTLAAKTRIGMPGADNLIGGDGSDSIDGLAGNDTISGALGDDTLSGGEGDDTLNGQEGNDSLLGGAGTDTLNGGVGNDTLDGGTGNDVLYGGAGNDTYSFGRGDGFDTIGEENDASVGKRNVLRFKAGISASDVSASREGDHLVLSINGTTDKIRVTSFFYQNTPTNTWNSLQAVVFEDGTTWEMAALVAKTEGGTSGADNLIGSDGPDTIDGLGGNDIINGAKGDDTLSGGEGNDTLSGGLGDDSLSGGEGDDTLNGQEGNDSLLGGVGADNLDGGAGNDTLDGGAGNDVLQGNAGNDTYLFGRGDGVDTIGESNDAAADKRNVLRFKAGVSASDVSASREGDYLVLSINGTTDKVRVTSFFYQNTPSNTWNSLQAVVFEDGTTWEMAALVTKTEGGTSGADNLIGSNGPDTLDGLAGNDTISGGLGDDTLSGGEGDDALNGQEGNDSLLGGAGADNLYGGAGNDTLDGGTGNDVLYGGAGNDTYSFGRGDGFDTIGEENDASVGKRNVLRFKAGISASDVSASREGDHLVLSINGTTDKIRVTSFFYQNTPTNTWNSLQAVVFEDGTTWEMAALVAKTEGGTSGADNLIGSDGPDTIDGLGGNDIINGAKGDDTLSGGEGNDTLSGGLGDDSLSGGEGDDTLNGQEGNDSLLGGVGADNLDGGAGNDTLDGGAGNDVLQGNAGNDTYLFGRGDGVDTIGESNDAAADKRNVLRFKAGVSASDVSASREGDYLVLSINGTTDKVRVTSFFYQNTPSNTWNSLQAVVFEDGTTWEMAALVTKTEGGTSGADNLIGSNGPDTLDGLAGNDTLSGGLGDDTLSGGDGDDALNGQDGNDSLLGGAGADNLYGGAGNDTLDGGAGNDVLQGDAGNDTYLFGRGDGVDTIGESNDGSAGKRNVLRFKAGVSAADVSVSRSGDYLVLSINGTTDKVWVTSFFYQNTPSNTWNSLQAVVFEDGTTWETAALVTKTEGGTAQGGSGSSSQSRAMVFEGFDTQAALQTATLSNQAQQLADAMAGFAPPAGAQTSGSVGAYSQLGVPVLAVNALA